MSGETPDSGWKVRRVAWLLLAVAAAVTTPSTDVFTLLLLWVPAVALFELGFLVYRRRKSP